MFWREDIYYIAKMNGSGGNNDQKNSQQMNQPSRGVFAMSTNLEAKVHKNVVLVQCKIGILGYVFPWDLYPLQ